MKKALLAVSAAFVLVQSARADDPAPPKPPVKPGEPAAPTAPAKHVNKVSPEAKAAFEKMEKISNCPVKQGLKDAAGTFETDMMGQPLSMKFTFKAPEAITVDAGDAEGPMAMAAKPMARGIERMLRPMFGIFHPAEDSEYDADLVKKDGKEVLVLTNFKDNVETSKSEFALDANGLISTYSATMQVPGRDGQMREVKSDVTFTWTKSGDLWRLSKIESEQKGGGQGGRGGGQGGGMGGGKTAITMTYTDIEKFALSTAWTMSIMDGQMSVECRMTDLTVNGKKVDLTKPAAKPDGEKKDAGGAEKDGPEKDKGGEKPK